MADQEEVSVLDAPPKSVLSKNDKHCTVCQVAVKQHVGKHGPGNCLGQAFGTIMTELKIELSKLKEGLQDERQEAQERETRLIGKISELSSALLEAKAAIRSLEDQVCAKIHMHNSECPLTKKTLRRENESSRSAEKIAVQETPKTSDLSTATTTNPHAQTRYSDVLQRTRRSTSSDTDITSIIAEEGKNANSIANDPSTSAEKAEIRSNKMEHPVPKKKAYNLPSWTEVDTDKEATDSCENEIWRLVTEKKPTARKAVVFIGNLPADATDDNVSQFISTTHICKGHYCKDRRDIDSGQTVLASPYLCEEMDFSRRLQHPNHSTDGDNRSENRRTDNSRAFI